MATASEILANMAVAKKDASDSARTAEYFDRYNKTPGITEALREKAFVEGFGNGVPFEFVDVETEAALPTASAIFSKLGLEDDPKEMKNGRTALQKFIDDFPKKSGEWSRKIKKDKALGDAGWEYVKDAWKQMSLDKMNENIKEGRTAILLGNTEEQNPIEYVGGHAMKFFTPRRFEAFDRGEDPTWKDNVGDAVESGLMAIPAGQYARVLGYVPKAGKALKANKAVANIFGNSVAPFASEAMDAAMRGDDDRNVERQDFSLGDALMGAATNLGVNFGLARSGVGAGRLATGELVRSGNGGIMGKVRDVITEFGKTRAERGLAAPITRWGKVLQASEMGAPTILVNRYGKDKDADLALNMASGVLSAMPDVPNLAKEVKDVRSKEHQEAKDRKTKKEVKGVKASHILELDNRDIKYLDAVANDPSVVKFGYAENPEDFKLWLLERGHKLLSGTGANRPLWEVK